VAYRESKAQPLGQALCLSGSAVSTYAGPPHIEQSRPARLESARRISRTVSSSASSPERDRCPDIGGAQHRLALRNDAEERRGEATSSILSISPRDRPLCVVARDQDVFFDAPPLLGLLGLGIEKSHDAIGIAYRRHDHSGIGESHRQRCAALDASRAVADHPVEFIAQFLDDARDALFGQDILVPGLRGRQRPQRLEPLVSDEGLRKLRDALDDVDRRPRDAPLPSADQGLRRPTSKSTTRVGCAFMAKSGTSSQGLR
jgi:hypothetical protein